MRHLGFLKYFLKEVVPAAGGGKEVRVVVLELGQHRACVASSSHLHIVLPNRRGPDTELPSTVKRAARSASLRVFALISLHFLLALRLLLLRGRGNVHQVGIQVLLGHQGTVVQLEAKLGPVAAEQGVLPKPPH